MERTPSAKLVSAYFQLVHVLIGVFAGTTFFR